MATARLRVPGNPGVNDPGDGRKQSILEPTAEGTEFISVRSPPGFLVRGFQTMSHELADLKTQPGGATALEVEGRYAAFRTGEPRAEPPLYRLDRGDEIESLEGVQWADWAADGRLLMATSDGRLEAWSADQGSGKTIVDLGNLQPDPRPTPLWASEW